MPPITKPTACVCVRSSIDENCVVKEEKKNDILSLSLTMSDLIMVNNSEMK